MKRFTVRNEAFRCRDCGEHNPPAPKTCRNHCRKCLASLHVDLTFPGDRLSDCNGLMRAKALEYRSSKKGDMLLHVCERCGRHNINRLAEDDNLENVRRISQHMMHETFS